MARAVNLAATLRQQVEREERSAGGIDDPASIHFGSAVEKIAHRLTIFRGNPRVDFEDVAKLAERLEKAIRKIHP